LASFTPAATPCVAIIVPAAAAASATPVDVPASSTPHRARARPDRRLGGPLRFLVMHQQVDEQLTDPAYDCSDHDTPPD
jgi:hypothetical protein